MAVVMLLRLIDSHLANGVPSSWSVNFWLDPVSFGALPCFLARCSRLTFVLSGPETWNQPLLAKMLFLLWAVVSRYQDIGHSPLGKHYIMYVIRGLPPKNSFLLYTKVYYILYTRHESFQITLPIVLLATHLWHEFVFALFALRIYPTKNVCKSTVKHHFHVRSKEPWMTLPFLILVKPLIIVFSKLEESLLSVVSGSFLLFSGTPNTE